MMIFFQGSQCPGLHQVHVQVSAVVFFWENQDFCCSNYARGCKDETEGFDS